MVSRDRAIHVYHIYAGRLQHRADIEERVSVTLPLKDHADVLKCIYIFRRISLIAVILSIIMLFSVDNDSIDF